MTTFGFIGIGNMGSALAKAAARRLPPSQILLNNRTMAKAEALATELGCSAADIRSVAQQSTFLFLGVKPQMMGDLLADLAPILSARTDRFLLVSMAAGLSISTIQQMAGKEYPVIRIMPNTPSSIGQGMILYSYSSNVSEDECQIFLESMSGAGRFAQLPEHLIDAGSCVSGCGPAFADLFIEALADGGVACGLPRPTAVELAAQMLAGSAQLVLETGQHPGALKDAVCSPGGTTIQGVRMLEQRGFRAATMDAVIAAYNKTNELS